MESACMDWGHVIAIIGTNVGLVAIVGGFILWAFGKLDADFKGISADFKGISNKLDADIKGISNKLDADIKGLSLKLDADIKSQTARLDQMSMRTDQLYQMFIDLLKEVKGHKDKI